MQEEGKITVEDYWQPASEATIWQNWISREQWRTPAGPRNVHLSLQYLDKIRILRSNKEDILRWGSNPKGAFNLKEAYKLLAASLDQQSNQKWQTLWSRGTWTKITLFSWLVLHNRALTWDNLQKRGFIGPSRCMLCENGLETLNHLLNTCPTACSLWDEMAIVFKQSDRDRNSIQNSLSQWRSSTSSNPLVNNAWNLVPGAIVWILWKEKNARIFKTIATGVHILIRKVRLLIKETINVMGIQQTEGNASPNEVRIIQILHLQTRTNSARKNQTLTGSIQDKWTLPPLNTFKLNFDKASRQNPGMAGYGTAVRDHTGAIHLTYHGNLGVNTNNAAELIALLQGLTMVG